MHSVPLQARRMRCGCSSTNARSSIRLASTDNLRRARVCHSRQHRSVLEVPRKTSTDSHLRARYTCVLPLVFSHPHSFPSVYDVKISCTNPGAGGLVDRSCPAMHYGRSCQTCGRCGALTWLYTAVDDCRALCTDRVNINYFQMYLHVT